MMDREGGGWGAEQDTRSENMTDVTQALALFLATQPVKGPTAQSFSLMRRDT